MGFHRKGVSFLSRFIGNKKKGSLDGGEEDGSEAGEPRPEGMNAQLFSHTVDNLGFSPKHLQPPAYIKVRTKFKKEKEFNRVFLAQDLRAGTAKRRLSISSSSATPSGAAASHNPIWALEFSKDGKYLAAGGQARVVWVWAVISTPEERRAHESEETDPRASGGESTHLSAPVFQQKPYREYCGHNSTILDLSWSKVSRFMTALKLLAPNTHRTTSCCRRRWTRPSDYGMSAAPSVCAHLSIPTSSHLYNSIRKMIASSLRDLWIQSCDYGVSRISPSPFGHSCQI